MNLDSHFPDIFGQDINTTEDSIFSGVLDTNGTGSDVVTNIPEVSVPPVDEWRMSGGVQTRHLVNNIVATSLALVTALAHIPVLVVLLRCRRMPNSLKLLTVNFVACSLLFFASVAVMSIIFLSLTEAYTQTFHEFRAMLACSLYASGICTVGGLALERYVRVLYPLNSTQILRTRYIISYIICAWVLGFLTTTIVMISQCDLKLHVCNMSQALNINRYILFTIFFMFSIWICVSCRKIYNVTNSHIAPYNETFTPPERANFSLNNHQEPSCSSQPKNFRKGFKATRYIMRIMITYVICHIPILINKFIFIAFPQLNTTNSVSILQMLSFVCSLVNFFISTHFFIWKFKESKLVFLQLFCSWNPRLSTKTRDLKMDVYNIPLATRQDASPGSLRIIPE